MRFFVTGEQNRQLLLNAIVLLFLVYMLLLCVSNALMFLHKMGLSAEAVRNYYLGSPEKFTQPVSYQSLLEITHFHLFSMGILAVTLCHLLLFTALSVRLKVWLSGLVFFSAIADEAGGWLVRFVHPAFAWFKLGSFLMLEGSLAVLIVVVSWSLIRQRNPHEPPQHKGRRHGKRHSPA
ncbi:MAG TPA: hypothetical protein VI457_15365 [Methylococcaceae bacterium]|nr:hypothetical protein [Methylococcaceae bacterium]